MEKSEEKVDIVEGSLDSEIVTSVQHDDPDRKEHHPPSQDRWAYRIREEVF